MQNNTVKQTSATTEGQGEACMCDPNDISIIRIVIDSDRVDGQSGGGKWDAS